MAYAQIHTDALAHWKVVGLSDAAFRLWIAGICYAQAHLTDGWLPSMLQVLRVRVTPRLITELVAAGLWERRDDPSGYQIHDYLAWNKSRERTERDKARARDRLERHLAKKEANAPPVTNGGSNGVRNGVDNGAATHTTHTTQRSTPSHEGVSAPTDPAALWHAWVQESVSHGIKATLTCSPAMFAVVEKVLDLLTLDEALTALHAFWDSPHFNGMRKFKMFASNAAELLAHAESGATRPFGVKADVLPYAGRAGPAFSEWTCPHTPHCGARGDCHRLSALEAARAEVEP